MKLKDLDYGSTFTLTPVAASAMIYHYSGFLSGSNVHYIFTWGGSDWDWKRPLYWSNGDTIVYPCQNPMGAPKAYATSCSLPAGFDPVPLPMAPVAAAPSASSAYPHKCGRCGAPAYIGMFNVDCSAGCR